MRGTGVRIVTALVVLATTLAALSGASPAATAATPAGVDLGMSVVRATAVDPTTGRVFVAGDDEVQVFEPDGTHRRTIPDVYGAGGMAISGADLWVTETTAGAIARIDLTTEAVAQTFTIGRQVGWSIVVHRGAIWFTVPSTWSTSYSGLASLDPTTGTVSDRGGSFYSAFLRTIPGVNDRLLVGEPGLSPYSLYVVGTTGTTITILDDVAHGVGSNLQDAEVTGTGRLVAASGSPYEVPEFDLATMDATGLVYPATHYPNGVAYTEAKGGVIAATTSSTDKIFVYPRSMPIVGAEVTVDAEIVAASVQLAPDATAVYVVTTQWPSSAPTHRLQRHVIVPAVSAATPGTVVTGVPTTVRVSGAALGATTAATVGGITAETTVVSTTTVDVEVPATVPVGTHTLTLASPLGTASTALTVTANTGATLGGTVRKGGAALAGATVTLRSPSLATDRTATTAVNGTYSFGGLPYGTYRIEVRAPASPTQVVTGLLLVPNLTTTQDVELTTLQPAGPALARVTLPTGTSRDLEVEPTTGRIFVSSGDEVLAFDRDGALLGRIKQQYGADGIALGAGAVWVNLRTAGLISRIDPTTITVTDTIPTGTPTSGGLAYAGGKLHLSNGDDQWVTLATLDPVTGELKAHGGSVYPPLLRNVLGAPDRYVWADNWDVGLMDASTSPPATILERSASASTDFVASATADRVWTTTGRELRLSTLTETGVQYPVPANSQAVAHTPARGGLLATGRSISRVGVPSSTHLLDDTPARRSLGFDAGGDRAFYVTGSTFVVWSLAPTIAATSTVVVPSTTLAVTGSGLGPTTAVTVDGTTAPFTVGSASSLTVTVAGLTPGAHSVAITTQWGTTTAPFQITEVPPTAPGAPLDVTATRANGAVDAAWAPPASNGGLPVLEYEAVASPGSRTCRAPGTGCRISGLTNGLATTVSVRARNAIGWGPWSAVSAAVVPGRTGDGLVPLGPERVLDSRRSLGVPGAWSPRATRTLVLAGTRGVPADASGVVLNLTATDGTAPTHVTVWPSGTPRPTASSLNVGSGTTRPNLVSVALGAGGAIDLYNNAGTLHLVADVVGYYDDEGSLLSPIGPTRVLDSRKGVGTADAPWGPVSSREVSVVGPVPAGADAALVNVTGTEASTATHLTLWPSGAVRPTASTLNLAPGETAANLALVPLGPDGRFQVYNHAGSAEVIIDVVGYLEDDVDAGRHQAMEPTRVLDSRTGTGGVATPWAAGTTRTLSVAGVDGIPTVSAGLRAVVVNVTAVGPTTSTHLTVWGAGARPSASTLNVAAGDVRANLAVVPVAPDGTIRIANNSGEVDVVADVVGYWTEAPDGTAGAPLP